MRANFRKISQPILTLVATLGLSACTVASMELVGAKNSLNGKTGGVITPTTKVTEAFVSDPSQRKVDILFVDDNSPSMDALQTNLGSKFPALATALDGIDWQLGITTTDCSNDAWGICGGLVSMTGYADTILTPAVTNFAQIFLASIVRPETVGCAARGACPTGNEEPLKATIGAINKRATSNSRLFRDDAALAVVILSDEDEQSNAPPTATTPAQLLAQFNAVWGGQKQLKVFAIDIIPGDSACLQSDRAAWGSISDYGTYASSLATTTGGLSESICATDYSTLLGHIGDNLQNLNHVVTLAHPPSLGSVQLVLNPALPNVTWTIKKQNDFI